MRFKWHWYLLLIALVCCTSKDSDFNRFVEKLDVLETPVSFKTMTFPDKELEKRYDDKLFLKFKLSAAEEAYGKVYEDDKFVGIFTR